MLGGIAECISFREVLTKLHEAMDGPLCDIADALRDAKVHLEEGITAKWPCERRALVGGDYAENLGKLLTATLKNYAIPNTCRPG
jgi:hypothetical protein